MNIRLSFLAAATVVAAAASIYSPAEAPAFSCSLCDSERMDESEMCPSTALKHSFYGTEGGKFNYNNPHNDWKCGYCIDEHTTRGGSSSAAISDIKRAISRQQDLQPVLGEHAGVASYDPESGQVLVAGCGDSRVGIAVPRALRGSLAD